MLRNERDIKLLNLTGHQGEVFMCIWNPLQRRIASGSADGICRLWGLDNIDDSRWSQPEGKMDVPNVVMPHCAHVGEKFKDVTSLSWSPDGRFLATGCYDGTARIWDDQGKLVFVLRGHVGPVFTIKWNKSGQYLLSGSHDKRTIVWTANTGTVYKTFELHTSPVLDVDWKDDCVFASCSSDMYVLSTYCTHPSADEG
jgi:transducin (beta)-like 1